MEKFLVALLVTSTLTGLVTEAIKNLCQEHNKTYYANTLAGLVAIGISVLLSAVGIVASGTAVTSQVVAGVIALIVLSWLCSMLGYDKVIQAIKQFGLGKDD